MQQKENPGDDPTVSDPGALAAGDDAAGGSLLTVAVPKKKEDPKPAKPAPEQGGTDSSF